MSYSVGGTEVFKKAIQTLVKVETSPHASCKRMSRLPHPSNQARI